MKTVMLETRRTGARIASFAPDVVRTRGLTDGSTATVKRRFETPAAGFKKQARALLNTKVAGHA